MKVRIKKKKKIGRAYRRKRYMGIFFFFLLICGAFVHRGRARENDGFTV